MAAPISGMISSVAVTDGQIVKTGDVLVKIDAMKMQTTINAPRNGTILRIVAPVGTQVEAADLIVEYRSDNRIRAD